jgi:hypothetical protein
VKGSSAVSFEGERFIEYAFRREVQRRRAATRFVALRES